VPRGRDQGCAGGGLQTAARDYPNLIVEERDVGDEGAPLSDDRFVAFGSFSGLGQLGDRARPLADRRSLLTRDPDAIEAAWQTLDGRELGKQPTVKAKSSRRSPPRRRTQQPRG
jgi:hypothetical protein